MDYICKIGSPLGGITLSSDGENLTGLWFEGQKYFAATLGEHVSQSSLPVFELARKWLDEYFSGKQPNVYPPLMPAGSAFRQAVWAILLEIPRGQTMTYGQIAARINESGGRTSARAVGGAVGHNPISLIIPCHRVVGVGGGLTGYAGGLDRKKALLQIERGC